SSRVARVDQPLDALLRAKSDRDQGPGVRTPSQTVTPDRPRFAHAPYPWCIISEPTALLHTTPSSVNEASNPLIASQAEIRGRIEQVKLSDTGYRRQLALLNVSPERRERLETDVRLAQEEIATLETLAQLGRVEPDRGKVEVATRERLDAVRARMSSDPALSQLTPAELDM